MTDPAGLTRGKWNGYQQHTAAKDQDVLDLLSASVLDLIGNLLRDDDQIDPSGVLGGLVVDRVLGLPQTDVWPGAALALATGIDRSDRSLSPWSLAALRELVTVSHSPGGADDRIDLVYLLARETDSREEIVQILDPGTRTFSGLPRKQEIRNDPQVLVLEGTPAPSPVRPTLPTGAIEIAEVLVPAGAVVSDGYTYADTRTIIGKIGSTRAIEPWAAVQFEGNAGTIQGTSRNVASVSRLGDGVYNVELTEPIPAGATPIITGTAYLVLMLTPQAIIVTAAAVSDTTINVCTFYHTGAVYDPALCNLKIEIIRG